MDNTEKDIDLFLRNIKPHFILIDFTLWISSMAHRLEIKAIHYCMIKDIEAALPEGFAKRVEGRGIVYGGWVQQELILEHPSVGCFVTNCGAGSLLEALLNKCQLVFLPQQLGDQIVNARMMTSNWKAGVEVEKGLLSKESVCRAIRAVMEKDSEIGEEVRGNHGRLREILLKKDLESS